MARPSGRCGDRRAGPPGPDDEQRRHVVATGELVEGTCAGTAAISTDDPLVRSFASRIEGHRVELRLDRRRAGPGIDAGDLSLRVSVSAWGDAGFARRSRSLRRVTSTYTAAVAGKRSLRRCRSTQRLQASGGGAPGRHADHRDPGDVTVIDDSFNATLDSVLGALDALAAIDAPGGWRCSARRDGIAYLDEVIYASPPAGRGRWVSKVLAYRAPITDLPVVDHRRHLRKRIGALPPMARRC